MIEENEIRRSRLQPSTYALSREGKSLPVASIAATGNFVTRSRRCVVVVRELGDNLDIGFTADELALIPPLFASS